MMLSKKKLVVVLSLLLLVISVPITMFLLQQRQDNRSKASASTTLSFTPNTPITAYPNNDIYLDIMVDPGTNALTYIRYHVTFDPNVMKLADVPFIPNNQAFPVSLEGPFVASGSVIQALSIGNDPTKVITKPTRVGTIHFKAIKSTNNEISKVLFGDKTIILSSGENDEATENVLSTSIPAEVIIGDDSPFGTPTPELAVNPTASITATPTPALSPTNPASPTSELTVVPTIPIIAQASLNVLLHGIGSSGDNVNTTASDFSNKNPMNPLRPITISFFNEANSAAATIAGEIKYSSESGSFIGTVGLHSLIPNTNYSIKVKTSQHLARKIPGIFTIQQGQTLNLPSVTLVTGDASNDNKISILDYNLLIDCYSDLLAAVACTEEKKPQTDLNDDGKVNAIDYNLFLRELSSQAGD